jgi:hypothetical protein
MFRRRLSSICSRPDRSAPWDWCTSRTVQHMRMPTQVLRIPRTRYNRICAQKPSNRRIVVPRAVVYQRASRITLLSGRRIIRWDRASAHRTVRVVRLPCAHRARATGRARAVEMVTVKIRDGQWGRLLHRDALAAKVVVVTSRNCYS